MGQAKQKRLKIDNMTTGLSDEAKTVFLLQTSYLIGL